MLAVMAFILPILVQQICQYKFFPFFLAESVHIDLSKDMVFRIDLFSKKKIITMLGIRIEDDEHVKIKPDFL